MRCIEEIKKNLSQNELSMSHLIDILKLVGQLKQLITQSQSQKDLQHIEEIIESAMKGGNIEIGERMKLVELLTTIQSTFNTSHIKKKQTNDLFEAGAKAAVAATAARALIGAGPFGMLAAGALGIASHFLFNEENEEELEHFKTISQTDLLTIAFYLSKFDHEILFGPSINISKAFEALANIFDIKANTIRTKRDYFDALIPSKDRVSNRKGFEASTLRSIGVYEQIIDKYRNSTEEEVRTRVINIITKLTDSPYVKDKIAPKNHHT